MNTQCKQIINNIKHNNIKQIINFYRWRGNQLLMTSLLALRFEQNLGLKNLGAKNLGSKKKKLRIQKI